MRLRATVFLCPKKGCKHVETLQELRSAQERETLLDQLQARKSAPAIREVYTKAIVQHADGLLTDADCLAITEAFELRMKEIGEPKTVAQRVPNLAERWREEARSHFKPHIRKKMPEDRTACMKRRRKLAASGYMPADIAEQFSTGQQAVLAIIAQEVGKLGTCRLVIEKIGALAGVCHATVRRAIARGVEAGLLFVQDRPVRGGLNLSNVVTITNTHWLGWIKHRFMKKRPLAAVQESIKKLAKSLFQNVFSTKCNPTPYKLNLEGNRLAADCSISISYGDFRPSTLHNTLAPDKNPVWALE